ncbi:GABA-A receptor [Aureococcus anophagefferens]|nr:GABA-A receptor [Aureococcus anophagefferens]
MTSWFFPEFRVCDPRALFFRFYYKSDVTLGFIDGMGVKVSIHNNPAEWTLKGAYAYTNSEDLWGQAWDYALLTLRFKRRSWYYVMEVFFPTIMFLLISYAGFFVARESAPARVATAVLPVLILRTRVSPADESYPLRSAEMDTLRRIFSSCDASGDGKIDHRELQTALKWYGVFLSPEDALRNVEIFLSKNNRPIPTAARHLTLNFDDFCEFMLYYDLKYRLAVSVSPSIKNSLLYQPPSLRLDIAARILYIPACIVCTAVLYLVHFGSNPPRSDEY